MFLGTLFLNITLIFNLLPNPKGSYGIRNKTYSPVCSLSLSLMIYMFILIRTGKDRKDRDKIGFFVIFIEIT